MELALPNDPQGGVFSPCSSNYFFLSMLKVHPPITDSNMGVLNHTHLGVLLTPYLSHNTNLTNLHSARERWKTRKFQVGERGTHCITHGLKIQLRPKAEFSIRSESNQKTFALQNGKRNTKALSLLKLTNTHMPLVPCWELRGNEAILTILFIKKSEPK